MEAYLLASIVHKVKIQFDFGLIRTYILITHHLHLCLFICTSVGKLSHNSLDFNETLRTSTTDESWHQTDYRQLSQSWITQKNLHLSQFYTCQSKL